MVKKVAVHSPVTKVMAMVPQTSEYSGIPRAMGNNPRVVVKVVRMMGRKRMLVPATTASRLERPDLYNLLMNSISTRESLTTTPVTPTIAMNELIVKSDLAKKVPYITPIRAKHTVEMMISGCR